MPDENDEFYVVLSLKHLVMHIENIDERHLVSVVYEYSYLIEWGASS